MNARAPLAPLLAILIGSVLASACGPEAIPVPPPSQTTSTVASAAPTASSAPGELVGTWEGSSSEPGIGATRKEVFTADGRFSMDGYPSIAERATFEVIGRKGSVLEVRMTKRLRCGPCESAGPNEPRPDEVRSLDLAADGQSFTERGWTLRRSAGTP